MSKHEMIEDTPSSSGDAEVLPPPANEPKASAMPRLASTAVETDATAAPKSEAASAAKREAEVKTATTALTGKTKLAGVETLHVAGDSERFKSWSREDRTDADGALPERGEEARHVSRFTLLAAAIALAAALGAMVGALAAYGLARPVSMAAAASRSGLEELQALKENIVQTRVELAALKLSIDSGTRNVAAQFTRIGERMDRVERAQAEPMAKLNKALEALERLSRGDAAPAPKDVTGAIAPPAGAANQAGKPGAVEGWVVRDVHRGTALIEGRMGLIEVDQGDVVPGLGRVDAIRKQDGRWVVVTSRGLIVPPR